jgi:hypothetical protein
MKFADEIMNNKKARIEQKLKEHNERVNEEMLEIEKAINTYEKDDENNKPYIDIKMIIKTDEAKQSLKEHRFYIDKVNQDIPYGVTRIYLDKTSYKIATRRDNQSLNIENLHKEKEVKEELNTDEKDIKDDKIDQEPLMELLNLISSDTSPSKLLYLFIRITFSIDGIFSLKASTFSVQFISLPL